MTDDPTAALLRDLDDLAGRAERAIQDLLAEREAIDEKVRRLRGVQKAVAPPAKKPEPKPTGKRPSTLSAAKTRLVANAALAMDRPTFTVHDVVAVTAPDTAPTPHDYHTFKYLREIEFLAKLGMEPKTHRVLWKIDRADALDSAELQQFVDEHGTIPVERA